jgi:hypothetical protein
LPAPPPIPAIASPARWLWRVPARLAARPNVARTPVSNSASDPQPGRAGDLRFALSLDEVGRGSVMHLRSPARAPRAAVEGAILGAARGTGLSVSWIRDSETGNSDHREFELAGLAAAKLGVPDDPCRHTACDRVSRLQAGTFPRVRRLVERLLAGVAPTPAS